jgi:lipid-A-disaccharide synthase
MKYYIIAGEASGDLHGSRLIRAIKKNDPKADIRAWGGDLMSEEGAIVVKHYRDLAFMGFAEVIANLSTILKNMKWCKADLLSFEPDVLILIDYPGFNLPIARFAKSKNIRTVYYISPQVWAWKEGRVKLIKKVIDKMLVILPFEKEFYAKWGYEVDYVGHPLAEIISDHQAKLAQGSMKEKLGLCSHKRIIALLPGSRKQEIIKKLPVMLTAIAEFPDEEFVVAQAPGITDDFIRSVSANYPDIKIVKNSTYELLSVADAALVTSGTATLETALFGVPEVVCYLGSNLTYNIAKRLVKVPYISLVNLIMGKMVVKELIQKELTPQNISRELKSILDPQIANMIKKDYDALRSTLMAGGKASDHAAAIIHNMLMK